MTSNRDRYAGDVRAVSRAWEFVGQTERANRWREGANSHLAGNTGCHQWATARRELAEFRAGRVPD